MRTTSPVEELLRDVESQESSQYCLAGSYRRLTQISADPGVKFLADLISEDAQRDGRLLSRMASSLRSSIWWSRQVDSLPPVHVAPEDRRALRDHIEWLPRQTREQLRVLEQLKHEAKALHDGLLDLLLDVSVANLRRHLRVLSYLAQCVSGSEHGGEAASGERVDRQEVAWSRIVDIVSSEDDVAASYGLHPLLDRLLLVCHNPAAPAE
ncbi:MAG: hypothetical protein ACYDAG_01120 [Chloroflexota bacterium]